MPEALILEFETDTIDGRDLYERVNAALGIDPDTGEGDWPAGLISHIAGGKPGGWVVVEAWESKDAQAEFMNTRLGPALGQADAPTPSRIEWLTTPAHHAG